MTNKTVTNAFKTIEANPVPSDVNVFISWLLLYVSTCTYHDEPEEIFRLKQAI